MASLESLRVRRGTEAQYLGPKNLRGSQGEYHMFVARVAYVDVLLFQLACQQNALTGAVKGAEKSAFAWWVSLPHWGCSAGKPPA
jgi:hypothetical protein